ncbi:MAG: hypothetical protein IPP94_02050 [Ignavibacteria bacterium]|nr:hypothetical protein [Ignavibacteria bacterium]
MPPETVTFKTLNEILVMCFAKPSLYTALCMNVEAALLAEAVKVSATDMVVLTAYTQGSVASPAPGIQPNLRSVMAFMFKYTQLKNDGEVVPAWGKTDPPAKL